MVQEKIRRCVFLNFPIGMLANTGIQRYWNHCDRNSSTVGWTTSLLSTLPLLSGYLAKDPFNLFPGYSKGMERIGLKASPEPANQPS